MLRPLLDKGASLLAGQRLGGRSVPRDTYIWDLVNPAEGQPMRWDQRLSSARHGVGATAGPQIDVSGGFSAAFRPCAMRRGTTRRGAYARGDGSATLVATGVEAHRAGDLSK